VKTLHLETRRHIHGAGVQVLHLVAGLRAMGDDAILMAPEDSEVLATADSRGIPTIPLLFHGEADFGFVRRFRARIEDETPDLVHLHSRRGADTLGLLAAWRSDVPTVLTRRVDTPEPGFIARLKYGRCDRVVTVSDGIRDVLIGEGIPPDQVVTVHAAIDAEAMPFECVDRSAMRREFDLPDDALVVVMVAQFVDRKGHDLLLDVLPRVLAAEPRTRVLLFGAGPRRDAITDRIERGELRDRVRLPGFRKDLVDLLPCFDLLVHPARSEGLGVALLEAAGAGLPVVATRVGGTPEALVDGRTGLLVEPGDLDALAAALLRLLGDVDLRRRMGAEGRAWVKVERSVPVMVRRNRAVYESVLTERARRS
jgi:glycosyltransferase involved in cell wall biosynthesis